MLRQKQRKTVEELYGNKFDASKSHVTANMQQNGGQKTSRVIEQDNGYIVNSHMPYTGANLPNATVIAQKSLNCGKETSRRKSARASSNKMPNEKSCAKEIFSQDQEIKKTGRNPMKDEKYMVYDNKTCGNYKVNSSEDVRQTHRQQQHQQQHRHHQREHTHRAPPVQDEDKDDDTDEFFDLIRRTVEGAIGKTISELLNRNFRELSSKVDRFSNELKKTHGLLNQLQNEMTNKISHYGEENSRHFRYLCMKSEYDKMFYQHQTLVATTKPPNTELSNAIKQSEQRKRSPKPSRSGTKIQRKDNDYTTKNDSCSCLSKKSKPTVPPPTEPREEHGPTPENVSQKSSEIGMREVLEQIKYFCFQRQFNNLERVPSSESPGTSQQRNSSNRDDNFIEVYNKAFEEDEDDDADADEIDDDWDISSDGMTPRNGAKDKHNKSGGITSRGGTTQRGNNGAGDG